MVKFLKEVFRHFFSSKTFRQGASLADFAVFSFCPLVLSVLQYTVS